MGLLKDLSVCFTLDLHVKWGEIRKKSNQKKDDILQEVLQKVKCCKYLMIKSENRNDIINTSKRQCYIVFWMIISIFIV